MKRLFQLISLTMLLTLVVTAVGPRIAWGSPDTWVQTSRADFEAGVLSQVDTSVSSGDVKLAAGYCYALQGDDERGFWRYDITSNSWEARADILGDVRYGGSLIFAGTYIYALQGDGTKKFWRYDIAGNSWEARADTPANVSSGGALVFAGTYIYALGGAYSTAFWRYDIAGNSWTATGAMTNTPAAVGPGGGLTYDGTYIYALQGNDTQAFWRYDITGNTWTATGAMTNTPAAVADGGALTYDGTYIYALRGNNQTTFWRYSITGNSWTAMAATPATVNPGGGLTYDRTYIYALRGYYTTTFWRYDIAGNSWTAMANAPGGVGDAGGTLVRDGYAASGTIASQVHDTGAAGTAWNQLSWSEAALPSGTDITFEVRASDTIFAKDAGTPPNWTSVGGTSPVNSGLPSGRYMQWRATLSTTNISNTPTLQDVTVNYTNPGITVSAISGNTTEAGGTATFTIVLNTQPTADVTIGLSSSDPTEGTVSPTSLTFTPLNWNAQQTVTVTGVDDAIVDGNIAYSIVTDNATSTDPNYNGLNASDVSVTNNDDDYTITASAGANGSISPSGAVVVNSGANQAFTITPDAGYHIADVLVDGVSQGVITGYTFTSVTADHTITASFAINQSPDAPASLGPTAYVDGSFGNDNAPTLEFTQSDPDGDTVKYQIQIDDTADFSSPIVDYTSDLLAQGAASFTVGQAADGGSYTVGNEGQTLADGSYYWRVMSTDSYSGSSGWTLANGGDIAFRIKALAENFLTETTNPGDDTVDNKAGANTEVYKSGTGTPTVTIARYASHPGGSAPSGFSAAGDCIDVHIDSTTDVTEIEIRLYYTSADVSGLVESSLQMCYWNGTAWTQCSDTGVDTADISGPPAYGGYIWARIAATTTPDLNYLLGSSFCGIGWVISGGGGGGGGAASPTTSLLNVDMLGRMSRVKVTNNGIIVEPSIVVSLKKEVTLKLDKGTRLSSGANKMPVELALTVADEPAPPPEGMVIISLVYDCVAYSYGGVSLPVNFDPPARLLMSYSPEKVPENALAVFVAYYDEEKGWVRLDPPSGFVAEAGTAAAQVSHFTPFAVLAELAPPPAYFVVHDLDINPGKVGVGEDVIISAQLANIGGMSGEYTLIINVEGLLETSQVIELAPGQSREISLTVTPGILGRYWVEIGGLQGNFTVVAPPPPPPVPAEAGGLKWLTPWLISVIAAMVLAALALILVRKRWQPATVVAEPLEPIPTAAEESLELTPTIAEEPSEPIPTAAEELREPAPVPIRVRNLEIIPNRVKPGGIINVFADITNTGPEMSSFSLVLKVRDIVEAVREITLGPGQSQKVAFIVLRDKPGVYDLDLEGLKGSFSISSARATY